MKETKLPIVKEGIYIGLAVLFASIILYSVGLVFVSIILLCLAFFVLFFFRNPKRIIPEAKDAILSPADGRVLGIGEVKEDIYLKRDMVCVSIFLSIFNVHVNRSPYSGVVEKIEYLRGKFYPAFREKASLLNEQNSIVISNNNMSLIVKQIAGIIARRVVCWVREGSCLKSGQQLGLIRFGSRVDLFLPKDVKIMVRVGDRVRGGETIIGKLGAEIT